MCVFVLVCVLVCVCVCVCVCSLSLEIDEGEPREGSRRMGVVVVGVVVLLLGPNGGKRLMRWWRLHLARLLENQTWLENIRPF